MPNRVCQGSLSFPAGTIVSTMALQAPIAKMPTTCAAMPPASVAPSVGEYPPHAWYLDSVGVGRIIERELAAMQKLHQNITPVATHPRPPSRKAPCGLALRAAPVEEPAREETPRTARAVHRERLDGVIDLEPALPFSHHEHATSCRESNLMPLSLPDRRLRSGPKSSSACD